MTAAPYKFEKCCTNDELFYHESGARSLMGRTVMIEAKSLIFLNVFVKSAKNPRELLAFEDFYVIIKNNCSFEGNEI